MPEFSPSPQQSQSPERSSRTPTDAFKRFMGRWNYSIAGGITGVSAVRLAMLAQESFARGDARSGTIYGVLATVSGIANILNTTEAHSRLDKSKETIKQQQQQIEELGSKKST